MKAGADDFLIANGVTGFQKLVENTWSFNQVWTDQEADLRWQLRDLDKDSPRPLVAKRLSSLVPLLARMDNLEVAGLGEVLKDELGLSNQVMSALRREIKTAREEVKTPLSGQTDKPDLAPEEEIKALKPLAAPLAKCSDILGDVEKILRRRGLAGQVREAKILYLAVTSRVLELKVLVNVALKGPSSGGKSFTVEMVLEFFPVSAFYGTSSGFPTSPQFR